MKTSSRIVILLSLFTVYLTACKKGPDVPMPETSCKILNFTYTSPANPANYIGTVSYNGDGNPASVVIAPVTTGNPHALFIYDKNKRLTDYIGSYGNNTDPSNLPGLFLFEYWVRYAYADNNPASLPIGDTVRTLGQAINGVISFASQTTIESFVYDAEKRIVSISATGTFPTPTVTFTYDANGNLVLPNTTYDAKKNFRQTNKVWMLIDRNYSRNNPFVATQYNAEGFPTLFPAAPSTGALSNFLRRSMNFKTMEYDCGIGKGK
jgi:dipeptidyl aminopeptidase/acylaminoacyl peptidase